MINVKEFYKKNMSCVDIARELADFCNKHHITRDKIINIQYDKANDGTVQSSALLIYEDDE